jgi:hypothetical protein
MFIRLKVQQTISAAALKAASHRILTKVRRHARIARLIRQAHCNWKKTLPTSKVCASDSAREGHKNMLIGVRGAPL